MVPGDELGDVGAGPYSLFRFNIVWISQIQGEQGERGSAETET